MYENFTDRAKKVVRLANQEAARMNCVFVSSAHLLIALSLESQSIAAAALSKCKMNPLRLRSCVVEILEVLRDRVVMSGLPQEPQYQQVLLSAEDQMHFLGDSRIGPEHLLLSLMHAPDEVVGGLLKQCDVTTLEVAEEVTRLLETGEVGKPNVYLNEEAIRELGHVAEFIDAQSDLSAIVITLVNHYRDEENIPRH